MQETPTNLKFTVDENIINHLITHQAGTLEKAVTEIIMNSIDSGATNIEITIDENRVVVKDNGKGFKDEDEIINYFGRFGTPHEEGDATFGRFRMGRGQLFSFGKSTWRSSSYKMKVDIKQGMSYSLYTKLDYYAGCEVTCELYEPKNLNLNHLKTLFEYCSVDIVLNGERISKILSQQEWTFENEFFYFKKLSYDSRLTIYNQGVFVCFEEEYDLDLAGILVSKKAMEVNFARNDILKYKCQVWGSLQKYAEKLQKDNVRFLIRNKKKVSCFGMFNIMELFLSEKIDIHDVCRAKWIKDVSGQYFSIADIIRNQISKITVGESNSVINDSLNQISSVLVLDIQSFYFYNTLFEGDITTFSCEDAHDLIQFLLSELLQRHEYSEGFLGATDEGLYILELDEQVKFFKDIHYSIVRKSKEDVPFITVRNYNRYVLFMSSHLIGNDLMSIEEVEAEYPFSIQNSVTIKLSKLEKSIFKAINNLSDKISSMIGKRYRELKIGDSKAKLVAWTDGKDSIYIDIHHLRELSDSVLKIESMAFTLIHEYCHDSSNEITNEHNMEFYKQYHDGTFYGGETFSILVRNCSRTIAAAVMRYNKKTTQEFSKILFEEGVEPLGVTKRRMSSLQALELFDGNLENWSGKPKSYQKEILNEATVKAKKKSQGKIKITFAENADIPTLVFATPSGKYFLEITDNDNSSLVVLALQVIHELQKINCGDTLAFFVTNGEYAVVKTFRGLLGENSDTPMSPEEYIRKIDKSSLLEKYDGDKKIAYKFLYLFFFCRVHIFKTHSFESIEYHAECLFMGVDERRFC